MPFFPDVALEAPLSLTIDALTAADAPALVDAFSDERLRRWLPLPSPYTLETATRWCTTSSHEMRQADRGFVLGIRQQGELVGSIDAKRVDWRAKTAEFSYWTAPAHRGTGIMPAAVRRVAEWMLTDQGFERIELRIAPANSASQRVAEKAGFQWEGTARNAGFTDASRVDLVVFSLIPTDLDSVERSIRSTPTNLGR
ncbi:GNAT family N-acetyltransferase [Microbacterium sp.]|uniref:GNAT family N-acetyltransferase n=1 Tax=Microbacterium sp. TaxID=51671 RepID=UPI003A945E5B